MAQENITVSLLAVCLRVVCLQSTSSGAVPYLGTYLTVLTMLDTALPDTVEVLLSNTSFGYYFIDLRVQSVHNVLDTLSMYATLYTLKPD